MVLEKIIESLLDCRGSNQSILKEINPEYSLEGLMLRLKLQYFCHLMWRADSSEKTLMLGRTEGGSRGQQDNMVEWHHTKPGCDIMGFVRDLESSLPLRRRDSSVVQFPVQSLSHVHNSLRPHGPQHAMLPCPSPTPRACSNPCPLSRWCHPTISSSVIPFSRLQSFPASGSFLKNQFFTSGGQSIGPSASASVPPMNIQDWFPLGLTGLISLSPRDSQQCSPTPQFKSINSLALSLFYGPTLSWLLEKP